MYVDYKTGGKSPWRRCELSEIDKHVNKKDFHVTWQKYSNERAGEYGEVWGDLPFDFDHISDINIARVDCIKVYDFLRGLGVCQENIRIYFSGNKGFHLMVDYRSFMDKPEFDLHLIYKQFYHHIESKIKPEKTRSTMDRQIYAVRKTIRHPNTIHPKSKLYKVPITYEELKTDCISIKKLAEFTRTIEYSYKPDKAMKKLMEDARTSYWKTVQEFGKRAALIEEYTGDYPPCVLRIFEEGVPEGEKNHFIYLLARFLKKLKKSDEVIEVLVEFADKIQHDTKSAFSTIKSAMNREGAFLSCNEFHSYCEKEKCNVFTKKGSLTFFDRVKDKFNSYSYPEAINSYATAKENGDFDRAISTGIKSLDKLVEIWKDGVCVIGALSNVGKTSLGISIAKSNPKKKGIYLAIEEGLNRTAKRFLEAEFDKDTDIKIVTAKLGDITPEDIWALCYCNSDAGFVIVDQLVNLDSAAREERLKYKKIMEKSRETARHFGIPFFFLHQLNREARRADEPCKEHLAEGADIERLAYDIWILFRKKLDGKLYNLLKIDKVKQGPCPITIPIAYDFKTKTFGDYTDLLTKTECADLGVDLDAWAGMPEKAEKKEPERQQLSFMDKSQASNLDWMDDDE